MKRYFTSKKEGATRKAKNKDLLHKQRQASYERKNEVLNYERVIFTKPLVEEKNPQCSIFNVHKFFLAQMSFSDYPSICPSVCLVSCPE